jgi:hypothetical protein
MGRYTFPAYNKASTPRYVVVWDLQWRVIDCQRLDRSSQRPLRRSTTLPPCRKHAARRDLESYPKCHHPAQTSVPALTVRRISMGLP